ALQRADPDHFMFVSQIGWAFLPLALSVLCEPLAFSQNHPWMQTAYVSVALNILLGGRWLFPPTLSTELHAWNTAPKPPALVFHRGRWMPFYSANEAKIIN